MKCIIIAGMGAAVAAKQKISPREVDVSEVRRRLTAHGAILDWSEE